MWIQLILIQIFWAKIKLNLSPDQAQKCNRNEMISKSKTIWKIKFKITKLCNVYQNLFPRFSLHGTPNERNVSFVKNALAGFSLIMSQSNNWNVPLL